MTANNNNLKSVPKLSFDELHLRLETAINEVSAYAVRIKQVGDRFRGSEEPMGSDTAKSMPQPEAMAAKIDYSLGRLFDNLKWMEDQIKRLETL